MPFFTLGYENAAVSMKQEEALIALKRDIDAHVRRRKGCNADMSETERKLVVSLARGLRQRVHLLHGLRQFAICCLQTMLPRGDLV